MGGRKHKKLADVDGTRRRPTSHRHRRQRLLGNVVVGVGGRQARRQFFDGIEISRPFLNLGARDFSFANIRNGRSYCCGGWSTRPTSSSAGGKFLPYDPYCSLHSLEPILSVLPRAVFPHVRSFRTRSFRKRVGRVFLSRPSSRVPLLNR